MNHMHKHPNILSLKDMYEDERAGYILKESGKRRQLFNQQKDITLNRAVARVRRTIMKVVQV